MRDLPPWPDAKPEHLGLANSTYWEAYERARGDAALSRLIVAAAELTRIQSEIAKYDAWQTQAFRLYQTLVSLGPLPDDEVEKP